MLDGKPRPRSDSYEARSTSHLDYRKLSVLARPRVGPLDPPYSPTLRQKSEYLMRLPTTFYHHGYNSNRCESSASVKSHFLLPIPGWEMKTCHYTHHTVHCFATDHPRGRIRQGPYPTISGTRPYPPILDPSSARPRPGLDPASTHRRSTGKKDRRDTGLGVFSPSHSLRHHGVQGWPTIPGACRYSHLHRDRQNFTSKAPPASLPPLTL
jgi:hypothetical protein